MLLIHCHSHTTYYVTHMTSSCLFLQVRQQSSYVFFVFFYYYYYGLPILQSKIFIKIHKIVIHQQFAEKILLTTDAFNAGIGTVIEQELKSQCKPVTFVSVKLSSAQTRYSTFSRELLAIYLAIKHFRHLH